MALDPRTQRVLGAATGVLVLVVVAAGLAAHGVEGRADGAGVDGPGHLPREGKHTTVAGEAYPMVRMTPGTFTMGSPLDGRERDDDEPLHDVTVTRAFAIGAVEVSQALYAATRGEQPPRERGGALALYGPGLPAHGVSWFDAVRFCNARSRAEGLDEAYTIDGEQVTWHHEASGYRLPTEAEWEYAALAGGRQRFAGTDDETRVCEVGNVADRSTLARWPGRPIAPCDDGVLGLAAPGSFRANGWGLYDMTGNVWEWVWDRYGPYPRDAAVDPQGPAAGDTRITRGGSWFDETVCIRAATRESYPPDTRRVDLGLRLARTL